MIVYRFGKGRNLLSRTENSIKNLLSAVIFQIINILIKFLVRTIFIYTLGKEYLGISGVFSNILTVLSLAELGFGTSIIYCMYEPIQKKNHTRLIQMVCFFKRIYFTVGSFIGIVGCLLLPFLDYIIKDVPNIKYIHLFYMLHLIDAVSTYFFAHYRAVLSAAQLERLNSKNNLWISISKTIAEIIVLIFTKSYTIYMIVQIVINVLGGYRISRITLEKFPFIKNKVETLNKKEKKRIWNNAFHMLNIRVGQTIVNATDNIIISSLISTVLVGIYSNYSMVIQIILTSTFLIEQSIVGSIGNLCVTASAAKKREIFSRIYFLYAGIFCIIFTCLFTLLTPFMQLWLGETYKLEQITVFFVVLNCYLSGMRQPIEAFINAEGLFKYFRTKPIIEAIINLIMSIWGAKTIGIAGVFLGTTISQLFTTFWYDPYIVCKYSLNENLKTYMKMYFKQFLITVASVILSQFIVKLIPEVTMIHFIEYIIGGCTISVILFILCNHKQKEFIYLYNLIKKIFIKS